MKARILVSVLAVVPLLGATCQDAADIAVMAGTAWLEVSCANNPKDYCESALTLSQSLALSLQERRQYQRPALSGVPLEPDPAVVGRGTTLALDMILVSGGRSAIVDGERIAAGEEIRLLLRPAADAWIYAVWIDAAGQVEPLHPAPGAVSAATPAGEALSLSVASPSRGSKGIEHLYVVASLTPRSDLAEVLPRFAVRTRSAPGDARVSEPSVLARGVEAPTVAVSPIPGSSLPPERHLAAEGEVVVTRWIRSE